MTDPDSRDNITIFATFTPRAGLEQAALDVLREVLAPTRAEPGCLRFDLFVSADRPTTYHLYEIFTNTEAIDAHRRTAHYRAYRASIEPLLDIPQHAVRAAPVDVR